MADEKEKGVEEKADKAEEENGEKKQQSEKETAEDRAGEAAASNKKRSETELDVEGLDLAEIPQEEAGEDKAPIKQKEKSQKGELGKRDYIMISLSLLLALIVVGGFSFGHDILLLMRIRRWP